MSRYSKQSYEVVARILNAGLAHDSVADAVGEMQDQFSALFELDNSRFDKVRFGEAVWRGRD